ncbi:MAG: peptidoglycan DD-metalloendopeptidase family protein [Thermodesulfovibrionales bacterium]|jgi:murein DD-endopeptidase MepM/ murein hydrolase activator NlpD|nr:peptidoglycan DD-metalloendopeptidase family protein [Thermodesulfovibrionales bacterium]
MKRILITAVFLITAFLMMRGDFDIFNKQENAGKYGKYREISGTVKKGETLFNIFKKYNLNITELFKIKEASANIHRLREVYPGQPYKIIIDDNNRINSFIYWIDDDSVLNIGRTEYGFCAEKKAVEYEKRTLHLGGVIKDNLMSSIGSGIENMTLALQLSDIFAWDIDFATDLRNGDTFKILVEGMYLNGEFKKFGNIFSAEFVNNGEAYRAYRFEHDGKVDYYDNEGKSLRRAFLKAPLSFRRVSSGFSINRFHPVLKIYRPHHGLDYAAPVGTPVSAIGDGKVFFAGYKGGYGKLIIIKHPNGYKTYYGHLSRFGRDIKSGTRVKQGQVIGYVGSTGLATGPHLHYEVRVNNRPVNPTTVKSLKGNSIPKKLMAEFRGFKNQMDERFASIIPAAMVIAKK